MTKKSKKRGTRKHAKAAVKDCRTVWMTTTTQVPVAITFPEPVAEVTPVAGRDEKRGGKGV